MATLSKLYSDIDFNFTKKPAVGDIALTYDTQAVIKSIRNLLLTKHYERFFNPDLGSNLDAILFENVGNMPASLLENQIRTMIGNYEPRANLVDVIVDPDPDRNSYNVTLTFYIANATLPTTVTLILERNR